MGAPIVMHGEVAGVLGINLDITERKIIEASWPRTPPQRRDLRQHSGPAQPLRPDGRLVRWNRKHSI
jgi:hypothetical protein